MTEQRNPIQQPQPHGQAQKGKPTMSFISLVALMFLWIEAVHLFTIPPSLNTLGSAFLGGLIMIFLQDR